MPELPEVETTLRGLAPHLKSRSILKVVVRNSRLRWPVVPDLSQRLQGARFRKIHRRAKYLLFETDRGIIMLHLGMSGSLRVVPADFPARTHDHVDILLDDGLCLRYHDPRRFGSIHLLKQLKHPLLDSLGPEPLGETFHGQYLYSLSRKRRVSVKQFIMDGRIVVGVGNIYANEALFMAGIHPARGAGRISLGRFELLSESIKSVLSGAIKQGGTTIRDFVGGDGSPGYFAQQLTVYGRAGLPCVNCGKILRDARQCGRCSVFCSACQR